MMHWRKIKEIIENGLYIVEGEHVDVCMPSMEIAKIFNGLERNISKEDIAKTICIHFAMDGTVREDFDIDDLVNDIYNLQGK